MTPSELHPSDALLGVNAKASRTSLGYPMSVKGSYSDGASGMFGTLFTRLGIKQHTQTQEDTHAGPPPYGLAFRSSEGFIVFTVSLAVFSDLFLYGVIVPVVPFALVQRSGVGDSDVQSWTFILVAAYGAALFVFSPICGWFADRTSSRRMTLLLGLLALTGSTVSLNLCNSVTLLVVGRVLQGVSGAVVWVVGLALLADTAEEKAIGKNMGYVALRMSLGILLAPMLGGIVFDHAGYNAVFAMSYTLLGVDIVLRLAIIEKKVARKWLHASTAVELEGGGAKTTDDDKQAANDTKASSLPMNEQPPTAIERPETVALQKRYRLPPMLSLLFSRRLLIALYASVAQAILITAFNAVLTIHVQRVFGWTSTGAGLLFLALVVPTFISPLAGVLSDRYGARYPVTLSFILATPLFVCLRFVTHNSLSQKVLLCALLALIGFSLTICIPPLMAEVTYVVQAKHRKRPGVWKGKSAYAQAYGLYNMAFAARCVLGPIWGGFVNETAGWGTMAWSLVQLAAVTAVPSFIWIGGSIWKHRDG